MTLRTFWDKYLIAQFVGSPGSPSFKERVRRVMPSRAEAILSLDPKGQEDALFRALNGRKVEIRSAGPDGQMNTSDDITN